MYIIKFYNKKEKNAYIFILICMIDKNDKKVEQLSILGIFEPHAFMPCYCFVVQCCCFCFIFKLN